jgi:single-stranded DNA-binding protein
MNIRIVDGRLTKDAQVKTSKEGKKFLMFTLANNSFSRGETITTYFNVVSYNDYDVKCQETDNKFSKGKLFVVSGFPNEVMTIKDNKTYLNRNIIAHNIEPGTFSSKETTQQTTTTTYHDVAPVTAPICETPEIPQPVVETIEKPAVSTEPTYTVSSPSVASQLVDAPDDLPF